MQHNTKTEITGKPKTRRPIATRNSRWASSLASYLANTRITPNQISGISMLFAAIAGLSFWLSGLFSGFWKVAFCVSAVICCQLRLLCNLLDGMVAVEGQKQTRDGPVWNELPDPISDTLILVGFGLGAGSVALGWAASTGAVLTAFVRKLGSANGLPDNFSGPMAKPHRMATVTAAGVVIIFLPQHISTHVMAATLWIIIAGCLITAIRRSRSMLNQLR